MMNKTAIPTGLTVEFDDECHEYRVDGVIWPSVTQILKPITNLDPIPAPVLERARWFGQCVHRAVELEIKGELDEATLDKPLRNVLQQFRSAVAFRKVVPIGAEMIVAHKGLRYCGTLDLLVHDAKCVYEIVDVKTGASAPTVGPQTAAYAACFEPVPRRSCLYLTETSYRWEPLRDSADMNVFISCFNIRNFREKTYGPRTTTN